MIPMVNLVPRDNVSENIISEYIRAGTPKIKHIKKLTLLHSNDLHGDFFAEHLDGKLVGGVSMLSGYINKVRSEEKNVLYAVAGDMFRGSLIDTEYRGISTIEIMNLLSPDVVTVGNHEIDYGISHLLFLEKCATFPIINANLYIRTSHTRLFSPCTIFEIDGMKILFIGIITESVLNQAKKESLISPFLDLGDAVEEIGRICNTYNRIDIDFTILLTHIGFDQDKELAARLDPSWGVDVILGGHSHTFMTEPVIVNDILIAQAGTGTDFIGRFDIDIDTDHNCVDTWRWECVPIDSTHCPNDPGLEDLIMNYKSIIDCKYDRIITRLSRQLTHPRRNQETELGNLFSDILRNCLGVDIMFLGSGSIRRQSLGPVVEFRSLRETFPYNDSIYMVTMTGEQLRRVVSYLLRDDALCGRSEFYQFSEGLRVVYSQSLRQIVRLTFCGRDVDDRSVFKVGLQGYHYLNLEHFFGIPVSEIVTDETPARMISTSSLDILEEYLSQHPKAGSSVDGRITVTDPLYPDPKPAGDKSRWLLSVCHDLTFVTALFVTAVFVSALFVSAVFVSAVFVSAVFVSAVFVSALFVSAVFVSTFLRVQFL